MTDDQYFPQIRKQGVKFVGLDATPTGSGGAFVGIADFTGAADQPLSSATLLPISQWYSRVDSQVEGTNITLTAPGLYYVSFNVTATAANRVKFGILTGNAAPIANPLFSDARIIAAGDYLGAAGEFSGKTIGNPLSLAQADINGNANLVRFMLTNAAGVAAPTAGLVLAECGVKIVRIAHVQSVA